MLDNVNIVRQLTFWVLVKLITEQIRPNSFLELTSGFMERIKLIT